MEAGEAAAGTVAAGSEAEAAGASEEGEVVAAGPRVDGESRTNPVFQKDIS